MQRTRRRALPRHRVFPNPWSSVSSCHLSTVILYVWVEPAVGICCRCCATRSTSSATRCCSKRRTTQNIVWGRDRRLLPDLIGWTAVTGSSWTPVVLFLVVFFWTPPAPWALALRYREGLRERRRADAAGRRLGRAGGPWSSSGWLMVATSLLLWPVADTGPVLPDRSPVLQRRLPARGAPHVGACAGTESLSVIQPMQLFHASTSRCCCSSRSRSTSADQPLINR